MTKRQQITLNILFIIALLGTAVILPHILPNIYINIINFWGHLAASIKALLGFF